MTLQSHSWAYIWKKTVIQKDICTLPFVETWMDLETVIQSEVSQKQRNKYRILMHICGTQKNGTDEPVCRAEIETKMQRTNVWTPKGESCGGGGSGGGVMNWEIGIDTYTLLCIKLMTNKNLLYKNKKKKEPKQPRQF